MPLDLEDETKYIDLVKVFEGVTSYKDWEGFADGRKVQRRVNKAIGEWRKTFLSDVAYELVLHWAYELTDTYQLPTVRAVQTAAEAISSILESRWYLRSTVK